MSKKPAAPRRRKQTTISSSPFRRRDLLVVAGVWLVGCVLVAGIVGLFYTARRPAESDTFPQQAVEPVELPFAEETAKVAYTAARTVARQWQSDVALVSMNTAWQDATANQLADAAGWGATFYSPGHERVYLVTQPVDQPPAGRPHLFKLRRPPPLIQADRWLVDSDEALGIWLNSGGNAFLEAFPENHVEMLLRQAVDRDTPVWNIIGTSADQSTLLFITVDAASGDILNRS
jgi:hypothetical protein